MKHLSTTALVLIACASTATAGGIDRTRFPISALFEKGNYAELSYGYIMPSQEGTVGGGAVSSGNMAKNFSTVSAAVKFDVTEDLSFKLVWLQPYGANVSYEDADALYPLAGTKAKINANAFAGVGRYEFGNGFSAHAGVRYVTSNSSVTQVVGGATAYTLELENGSGVGYLAGVAYERPELALRAAFTYMSKIGMEHDIVFNGAAADPVKYDLPERFVLDFQTGIAPNTLLTAQIIHSKWTQMDIDRPDGLGGTTDLLDYDQDSTQYSVGIGRRFNDKFSGSFSVGYEKGAGSTDASNLSPSNGVKSVSLGGRYVVNEALNVSGGVTYQWRGSATTELIGAEFDNNSLVGIGIKVGYNF